MIKRYYNKRNIRDSFYKRNVRFISTHPDEDHIHGLELLNKNLNITNFYCVKNNAKNDFSQSFEEYKN